LAQTGLVLSVQAALLVHSMATHVLVAVSHVLVASLQSAAAKQSTQLLVAVSHVFLEPVQSVLAKHPTHFLVVVLQTRPDAQLALVVQFPDWLLLTGGGFGVDVFFLRARKTKMTMTTIAITTTTATIIPMINPVFFLEPLAWESLLFDDLD